MNIWLVLCIFCLSCHRSLQYKDNYNEELLIKQLPTGHIYSYFQFTTKWYLDETDSLRHSNLVSRSIAELFLHYDINELHVSFTNGVWNHEQWGYPVIDAAPGAEVLAWFNKNNAKDVDSEHEIDKQWKDLCSTLSGLTCASLSFIDHTNTVKPQYSMRPQFINTTDAISVRYATLPREIVCTENLTPWKKLLPCNLKEGFLSLLNPDHIYSTNYHSLGIHVRKLCLDNNCSKYVLEIKQTVNLVHDILLFGGKDWSLRKLYGQGLNGACNLAESSKIYLDITDTDYNITPTPGETITSVRGGTTSIYNIYDIQKSNHNKMFNMAIVDKKDFNIVSIVQAPPLHANRFILGVGQERGRIVTRITNTHWSNLNIVLLENIPWFVPIYLHTLSLKINGKELKPTNIVYIPGQQRVRPYHLEIAFKIPARSVVEVSIDFDYIFLKWQEYPPDANHGHYVGSAIISTVIPVARNYTSVPIDGTYLRDSFNASRPGYFVQIKTEALLLLLPTPDFSMPYNVICLACTVVALAFGPIHNISTKQIILQSRDASPKLFTKLKNLFKKKPKDNDNVEEEEIEISDIDNAEK